MEDLLRSLKHRTTWTNARKILKSNGVSTGIGWDATIEKFQQPGAVVDAGRLEEALIEHILCGQKFTKLYPISPETRQRLQDAINQVEIVRSPAVDAYPYVMPDEELLAATGDILPVRVETNGDGIGLVLSSVFHVRRRVEITFDEFGASEQVQQEMRARFDEVVGIVREPVQMMHVVWIPHHRDFAEIRVDSPKGVAEADIHGIHSMLRTMVNKWGAGELDTPVNLFPAVRPFYEDPQEGIVTQMTFQTTTGGIKDEKMPRRRRDADQRTEPYHVAGKQAVEAIAIYRITVEWGLSEDGLVYNPSISLAASGPSGRGPNGSPTISGVLIENCARAADYEYAVERLGLKANLDL